MSNPVHVRRSSYCTVPDEVLENLIIQRKNQAELIKFLTDDRDKGEIVIKAQKERIQALLADNERYRDLNLRLDGKLTEASAAYMEEGNKLVRSEVCRAHLQETINELAADNKKLTDTLTQAQQEGTKLVLANRELRDNLEARREQIHRLLEELRTVTFGLPTGEPQCSSECTGRCGACSPLRK